jgi:hypothetical protein
LIVVLLYGKGIKSFISLAFSALAALFLWEFSWWGKAIIILFGVILISSIIYSITKERRYSQHDNFIKDDSLLSDNNIIEIGLPYGDINLSKIKITKISTTLVKRIPYYKKIQNNNYSGSLKIPNSVDKHFN